MIIHSHNSTVSIFLNDFPNIVGEADLKYSKKSSYLKFLTFLFCIFGGVMAYSVAFTMSTKVDDLDDLFAGHSFAFIVMVPSYMSVPLSILLTKLLTKLTIGVKMAIVWLIMVLGFILTGIVILNARMMNISVCFYMMMSTYFCTFIFVTTF